MFRVFTDPIELSKEQSSNSVLRVKKVEIRRRNFVDGIGGTCHWSFVISV